MADYEKWRDAKAKGRTSEHLARLDAEVVVEAERIQSTPGGYEVVWQRDGTHSTYADVRVGALTVRLRASYWGVSLNRPGESAWVPSVRRLSVEGDDPLAGPVAMGNTTPDREIVVIEDWVEVHSIEAAQTAAERLLVRAYGPATAWAAARAEQNDAAPLIGDERVDLALTLLDAARALNSGALINGQEAMVAAPAYHALQAAARRAEPAYAGDRCLRYARLVADAVNDRLPLEERAAARARATAVRDRLLAVLAADDPRRATVASLWCLLEEQPEGDGPAEGDDRCPARVPPNLPGPHTPPSLVGARCEVAAHEHGSHHASEGAAWVSWKDGQLVGSSLHDEARRGGAAGG